MLADIKRLGEPFGLAAPHDIAKEGIDYYAMADARHSRCHGHFIGDMLPHLPSPMSFRSPREGISARRRPPTGTIRQSFPAAPGGKKEPPRIECFAPISMMVLRRISAAYLKLAAIFFL